MERKRFSLEKAQTEAIELQKKVEYGEAPDYSEAEKILEQEDFKQKIISNLKRTDIGKVIALLQKNTELQEITLADDEVKGLLYERYKWLLSKNNERQAKELEPYIRLTKEEQLETDVGNLKLEDFDPESLFKNITEDQKNHPEVQKRLVEIVKEYTRKSHFDAAFKIVKFFGIPKEIFINELMTKNFFRSNQWEKVLAFQEKFSLPDSFIQKVIRDRIINVYFSLKDLEVELGRSPDLNALFLDEGVVSKITEVIAYKLSQGDFSPIQQLIQNINIPDKVKNRADEIVSSKIQKNQLIKFIKFLSIHSEISFAFPKTMERARDILLQSVGTSLDLADYFFENMESYYQEPWVENVFLGAVLHYSVAQKFLQDIEANQIWANIAWIEKAKAKAKEIIKGNSGHGDEKFIGYDPYETHQYRFGVHQMQISSEIVEFMMGREKSMGKLRKLGFETKELPNLLAEVSQKIDIEYKDFLEQVRKNPQISDEDKVALLNPEKLAVRMVPLINTVRYLVARYIAQLDYKYSLGDNEWLNTKAEDSQESYKQIFLSNLETTIKEGFTKFITIHEVDVPLYDKLYEEFDTLRETGRYPLEVYLGRDGIYAYVGRRAQDVARRRKLGMEGRKKLKEVGEVIEIHPRYIVYPRYFRDNIDYQTKRQFLEQEGISPSADPLFYDTGYTGTIPEQIMRVMDFGDEDIEQRIRLLSASNANRRIKGIAENARSEIIEYIEHNAKTEESAEGLIIDEKTGKIRHIAKPTSPEEQFYFMMVKQAISRHYWLQEQLHHEPSGNVNLDSEHYTIRIRQEYARLLPAEFIEDPKQFFSQHGELLKGGRREGQYPDEEVVLFKLYDGTEIVAKRIELRKAKEARKEFSILIAAKKSGLPTAEPVGFLSGKEDQADSYLLMKKLEGRSGRKFEKELRESGKYSEDQIKGIMQQVLEKNNQMAELFRATLKIDKRWRIKDTIIEFNEETGQVESIIPIDWERAQNFNPATPKEIDELD